MAGQVTGSGGLPGNCGLGGRHEIGGMGLAHDHWGFKENKT
jgi:hypothetical protein